MTPSAQAFKTQEMLGESLQQDNNPERSPDHMKNSVPAAFTDASLVLAGPPAP